MTQPFNKIIYAMKWKLLTKHFQKPSRRGCKHIGVQLYTILKQTYKQKTTYLYTVNSDKIKVKKMFHCECVWVRIFVFFSFF